LFADKLFPARGGEQKFAENIMSKINIEKSILTNSPIIADSPNSAEKKIKNRFFDKPIVKIIAIPLGLIVIGLIIEYTFFNKNDMSDPKVNIQNSQLENSPVIVDSPNATVSISTTDKQIQSISVEAKLLGTKRAGSESPPTLVNFTPISEGSNAKIGSEILIFQSPVRFNTTNDTIEVINNFSLQPGSQLQHRAIEDLKEFQTLTVPIVTVVYGNAIETMKKLSISMKVNGKEVFNKEWPYNAAFQIGPTFTIPLKWEIGN
jgi:hypothetical protein